MASTPLYKRLKENGTTTYVFPSVAEDISASYNNVNYKMYFSKFALLNFPKQNNNSKEGRLVMSFYDDDNFKQSSAATPANTFSEQIVDSLRNYVANQEVVIKESRLSSRDYYYDTNECGTLSEEIFFKWAKKLNLIDFERAVANDEYFANLQEFETKNINDPEYLPEYLWKERETNTYELSNVYSVNGNLVIVCNSDTNWRVGDTINVYDVDNSDLYDYIITGKNVEKDEENHLLYFKTTIIEKLADNKFKLAQEVDTNKMIYDDSDKRSVTSGSSILEYNRFVQYVGEITGVSNNQEANRNYSEIYAHIADYVGQTPDILFRTVVDENYKPNLEFPIKASEYQPEIKGAESYSSPIVNNPTQYPGSYYAIFDTEDYSYITENGDELRRSGKYFGVSGDINNGIKELLDDNNRSTIDGIHIDFNTGHYVKMNTYGNYLNTFDEFNALSVNNEPPISFEFNAILWYYTVEKTTEDGDIEQATNLYGISFFNNPENNETIGEEGIRFPVYKKIVSCDEHDGTAYAFSLNLNFNVINDTVNQTYNPESINSVFGMNLFNTAMSRLAATNDSFLKVLSNNNDLVEEITNLKQIIYTTTDINTINKKISNLEKLLTRYSTMQIVDSDSIKATTVEGTPSYLSLQNIDTFYDTIRNIKTNDLFNGNVLLPYTLTLPENRAMLVNVINDDNINTTINEGNLRLVINNEFSVGQILDINIDANSSAKYNKKLDIYIESDGVTSILIRDIDFPVYVNSDDNLNNSFNRNKFGFEIDTDDSLNLEYDASKKILYFPIKKVNSNILSKSVVKGDVVYFNDFILLSNNNTTQKDYSGQYIISDIETITSPQKIGIDISKNNDLLVCINEYITNNSTSSSTNNTNYTINIDNLCALPYVTYNKGMMIRINCVDDNIGTPIADRYIIEKRMK